MTDHGFTTTFAVERIRVTEAVPGRKVSRLMLDNYFNFTEDKSVSA